MQPQALQALRQHLLRTSQYRVVTVQQCGNTFVQIGT